VSHTWSLSVEEQFYLIWPMLLLLSGRRLAPYVLLALVLSSPLLRAMIYFQTRQPANLTATYLNLDHVGLGCLLAFWRDALHRNSLYMKVLGSPAFILVPAFILFAATQGNHPSIHRTAGLFLINLSIALCVDWAVTFHNGQIGRELNRSWIIWIGTISYSIYLWQQPFTHFYTDPPALYIHINPIFALCCSLACACLSYYLVERPCLRLRERIERQREIPAEQRGLPVAATDP
jgi:peptidoglycan/LPS O-acetylase OafA/YrhL